MTNPMTPTEQDKLRELVHLVQNADTTYDAMQFITADRKRVALEARIEELRLLGGYQLLDSEIVYGRHSRSYRDRIADIKAQQEEV